MPEFTSSHDLALHIAKVAKRSGRKSVIALSGVAGTGKSHIAAQAADMLAQHPLFVRQIQFHQGYSYEDFVEGLEPNPTGGFAPRRGVFAEWNDAALSDPDNQYVLLIEEMTRANITSVLGELMTYVEHRDRYFDTPILRRRTRVAENLVLIATFNPQDRSALEIDDALVRRLRIINIPPSAALLRDMFANRTGRAAPTASITDALAVLFETCKTRHPDTFSTLMPFGHGVFADVETEEDLRDLWEQQLRHLLRRPQSPPHPFCEDIEELFPWK